MPTEMTISQLLRRIKKIKGELAKEKQHAESCVSFDVRREPAFKFEQCAEKISSLREELITLESKLAVANADAVLTHDGQTMTLAKAVRVLQELKGEIAWIQTLPVREQEKTVEDNWEYDGAMNRVKTTIEWRCAFPRAKVASTVATLQEKFDALNDAVETMNHRTLVKS